MKSDPNLRDYIQSDTYTAAVPHLRLCKTIPEDSFTNSRLVWEYSGALMSNPAQNGWVLTARRTQPPWQTERYPAPTLLEIMRDIIKLTDKPVALEIFFPRAEAYITCGNWHYTLEEENPQDSALMMWFQLKGVGCADSQVD